MKKIIALIVLIIIILFVTVPTGVADENILSQERSYLQIEINKCGLSTNYTTRELLDLAGNKYILVECKSGGYGIYHPTAQVFVEFSAKQPQKQKSVNL